MKKIEVKRNGFALPTILIASIIMLTVLLSSVVSTSSYSNNLRIDSYNNLASTAAKSGINMAKNCIESTDGLYFWPQSSPLKFSTDCYGVPKNGINCADNPLDSNCSLSINDKQNMVTSFNVTTAETSLPGWRQVSAGYQFTCAVGLDNRVYCWGLNSSGQLGNGSFANSNKPVKVDDRGVLSRKNIRSISAGKGYACAIAYDQQAYCWGDNTDGQLGNGTNVSSPVPVAVTNTGALNGLGVLNISTSLNHTCAVASNSKVFCWGSNVYGQLGDNTVIAKNAPVAVNTTNGTSSIYNKNILTVSVGPYYSCIVTTEGLAHCWGRNSTGQLGDNSTTTRQVPVAVNMTNGVSALYGKTVLSISTNGITETTNNGNSYTCAVSSDGLGYCWGYAADYQLGDASATNKLVPVAVRTTSIAGKKFLSISNAERGTCALLDDGAVYCWALIENGNNTSGESFALLSTAPISPAVLFNAGGSLLTSIDAGNHQVCSVATNSQLYCWGYNSAGELGIGSDVSKKTVGTQVVTENIVGAPDSLIESTGIVSLVNKSGEVWREYKHTDKISLYTKTWSEVVSGGDHSCGIDTNGRLYCWGRNDDGQIGDGTYNQSSVPVAVSTSGVLAGKTIKKVSLGRFHTCAVASDNKAYCWGKNASGELGNASAVANSNIPVAVTLAGLTVSDITSGYEHNCLVTTTSLMYCWGNNGYGRLGDNSIITRTAPVQIYMAGTLSGLTIRSASAMGYGTCAIASNGNAYCWGSGGDGQLGQGVWSSSQVPVAVSTSGVLSGKSVLQISGGALHACVVASDSKVYCWGYNEYGQVGDDTVVAKNVPTAVNTTAGISGLYGKIATRVQGGGQHTCVLTSDGSVYCWGQGDEGQLGVNSTSHSRIPNSIIRSGEIGNSSIYSISLNMWSDNSCVTASTGKIYCWGLNSYGSVGNGNSTQINYPTAVKSPFLPSINL